MHVWRNRVADVGGAMPAGCRVSGEGRIHGSGEPVFMRMMTTVQPAFGDQAVPGWVVVWPCHAVH